MAFWGRIRYRTYWSALGCLRVAKPKWDLPVWQPVGLTHAATPLPRSGSVAPPHRPVEPYQRSSRSPARSHVSPAGSLRFHQRTRAENGRRTHTALRVRFRLLDILIAELVLGCCDSSQVFLARSRSPTTTPKDHEGEHVPA